MAWTFGIIAVLFNPFIPIHLDKSTWSICSSYSGISEIIKDGKQGIIVKPNETVDIKKKLKVLMTDDTLRFKMGQEARKLAETFTIEKQIKHVFEIYNSLD